MTRTQARAIDNRARIRRPLKRCRRRLYREGSRTKGDDIIIRRPTDYHYRISPNSCIRIDSCDEDQVSFQQAFPLTIIIQRIPIP
ncbi:MAG: hypothetical protein M2R45_02600 [Verrucomicrobia subdivision 3 bacterium]|nr:hypothetical protein [Limisphaerales bacterium]